jgi:hypothetical protein
MADPFNTLKGRIVNSLATEGAGAIGTGGGARPQRTYGIIKDDGYGTRRQGMTPDSYIVAETPQQARAAFLQRNRGSYAADPKRIKAVKIQDGPIDGADQYAVDWLPGGKYWKP